MALATIDTALYAIAACAYGILTLLLLCSRRASATRAILVGCCAVTAVVAAAAASGRADPSGIWGAAIELGSTGSWCLFTLLLLRRQEMTGRLSFALLLACAALLSLVILGYPSAQILRQIP